MKSTLLTFSLTLVLLLPAAVARGQLAPPNDAGVTMGQLNLRVRDVEATKKLFLQIGGTPTKLAPCCPDIIKYPGVLILLRKADPTGGMEGSTVNHIGFLVKDGATLMAKFKAEGLREESNGSVHGGYVFTPDGIKIEILERPDLPVPVQFDQVHFFVADPAPDGGASWSELQAWYTKTFGAMSTSTTLVPTKSGLPAFAESKIPGVNLRFSKIDSATVGTKGRALDHIGFEVKNLAAFCKKLEGNGVKLTTPYREIPEEGIGLAFVTDPWGTGIELNEGLDKL